MEAENCSSGCCCKGLRRKLAGSRRLADLLMPSRDTRLEAGLLAAASCSSSPEGILESCLPSTMLFPVQKEGFGKLAAQPCTRQQLFNRHQECTPGGWPLLLANHFL